MEQIFTIFSGKIKKWAVAHDVAPTTGMIHYHLYLELFEAWKVLDARKKFKVIDTKKVEIIPNIKTSGGTKEAIAYIAKKELYKTNMDMHYELKTKKLHQQLVAYELIQDKTNLVEATEMYPELLFKYDSIKSNLNSFKYDREMLNTPGNPLIEWNMFGIQTWFLCEGKTPQYWIVGPSNVGKTYNIDTLEGSGHRAYLMSKENDWSDYNDSDYDFMYNEETGVDYKLTFLNQLLEGTRTKLSGKYVKSITKKKNMPIILNSNYMPHMLYKNTSLYDLAPTLNRLYIIYVDKLRRGHIIWNSEIMDIGDYASLFMNNEMPIENYEARFYNEFINESHTEKSYIKYLATFEREERAEMERKRREQDELIEEGERLVEEAKKKKREQSNSKIDDVIHQNIASNSISESTNTAVEVDSEDDVEATVESEELDSSRNLDLVLVSNKADMTHWQDKFNSLAFDDESSVIEDSIVDSDYIDYSKLEPSLLPSHYINLYKMHSESSDKNSTEASTTVAEKPVVDVSDSDNNKPRFSDIFKKRVDTTTSTDLGKKLFDEWMENRKNKGQL